MKYAAVCTLFPLMPESELNALAEDIKANGLRNPVVTYRGEIIDGRNRWLACEKAGVVAKTVEWNGQGSLVAYVLSLNLHRRQLTASQRAMVAAEALPLFEAEAAKRKAATQAKPGQKVGSQVKEKVRPLIDGPKASARRADDEAAASVGVSRAYVAEAKSLKQSSPALAEKVKSGELTITQAKREVRKEEHAEKVRSVDADESPEEVGGPYDIIMADPPWRYDHQEAENRAIENKYQTATIDEICRHVPNAKKDSILFLWGTAPKLQEAFQVMKAWGFTYKTCAVWDKEIVGMGYWFRGQHELLLVGVKGSPGATPEPARRSSVFREKRRAHSEKPECVFEWINHAFPGSCKLEMYCRNPRKGWSAWGNEV